METRELPKAGVDGENCNIFKKDVKKYFFINNWKKTENSFLGFFSHFFSHVSFI